MSARIHPSADVGQMCAFYARAAENGRAALVRVRRRFESIRLARREFVAVPCSSLRRTERSFRAPNQLPMCSNAKFRMDWSNETTLLFIELYKKNTCLWNPTDKNYKLRCVKNNAWKDICGVVKCSPHEARRKIESLLASFRRERNKELRTTTYRSSWFAFRSMQFLMNKSQPSCTENSPVENNTPTSEDSRTEEEDSIVECSHDSEKRSSGEVKSAEKAISSAASNKIEKRKEFVSPRRLLPKRKKFVHDPQVERAYRIIEDTVSKRTARDASTVFGEHVAMKHRSYDRHTQSVVEHLISNILFDADMGKYNENSQSRDDYTALPVTPALSPSSSLTAPRTSL